ncbi:MAG: type I-E CRISPR-associated protein Cse1/CasA, partial [Planctomycetota bacterium]
MLVSRREGPRPRKVTDVNNDPRQRRRRVVKLLFEISIECRPKKLDLTLASGNNASLFDNAAGNPRAVDAGRLALTLLAFQCFSPGGRIGVAKWNGADTAGKGSSNHAPCTPSSMLHTFLHGPSLLDTIHLNLLNKEEASDLGTKGWGRPVWELPVTKAGDKEAIANATGSYLGRLVPLSRAIRLDAEGRQMILANGLDYPLAP